MLLGCSAISLVVIYILFITIDGSNNVVGFANWLLFSISYRDLSTVKSVIVITMRNQLN